MSSAPSTPQTSAPDTRFDEVNLRDLLGLEGTEQEIAEFEDEFEDSIFQDVIEAALLDQLSDEDVDAVTTMLEAQYDSDEALQDAVLAKLREFMPDVEERLQTRVREAKAELFEARLAGLQEHYANQPTSLQTVQEAAQLHAQGKSVDAVAKLQTL